MRKEEEKKEKEEQQEEKDQEKKQKKKRRFTEFTLLLQLMGEVGVTSLELNKRVFK